MKNSANWSELWTRMRAAAPPGDAQTYLEAVYGPNARPGAVAMLDVVYPWAAGLLSDVALPPARDHRPRSATRRGRPELPDTSMMPATRGTAAAAELDAACANAARWAGLDRRRRTGRSTSRRFYDARRCLHARYDSVDQRRCDRNRAALSTMCSCRAATWAVPHAARGHRAPARQEGGEGGGRGRRRHHLDARERRQPQPAAPPSAPPNRRSATRPPSASTSEAGRAQTSSLTNIERDRVRV